MGPKRERRCVRGGKGEKREEEEREEGQWTGRGEEKRIESKRTEGVRRAGDSQLFSSLGKKTKATTLLMRQPVIGGDMQP